MKDKKNQLSSIQMTEHLTPPLLQKLLRRAYLRYYLDPALYLRHFRNLLKRRQFYLYFTTLSLILSNLLTLVTSARFSSRRSQRGSKSL